MPELPEVETICRDLQKRVCGKTIQQVTVTLARLIKEPRAAVFCRIVRNSRIEALERKGKALIFTLCLADAQTSFLVIHLRMTGQLLSSSKPSPGQVIFHLSDSRFLCYNDSRTLGEIRLVSDLRQLPFFRDLGPEPLSAEFSKEDFTRNLRSRRGTIKSLLLNQRFLAGVGNIYACEALFAAKIRPHRPAKKLRRVETERLYHCLREVLQQAIKCRGTSLRDYRDGAGNKGNFAGKLRVYGRAGQMCQQCGTLVQRAVISGRGTFYCPGCQR